MTPIRSRLGGQCCWRRAGPCAPSRPTSSAAGAIPLSWYDVLLELQAAPDGRCACRTWPCAPCCRARGSAVSSTELEARRIGRAAARSGRRPRRARHDHRRRQAGVPPGRTGLPAQHRSAVHAISQPTTAALHRTRPATRDRRAHRHDRSPAMSVGDVEPLTNCCSSGGSWSASCRRTAGRGLERGRSRRWSSTPETSRAHHRLRY